MEFYVNGSASTTGLVPRRALEHTFAWRSQSTSEMRSAPEPRMTPELAAEIREAFAAIERGELVERDDYTRYADEPDED